MTYLGPSSRRRLLRAGAVLFYAAAMVALLINTRAGAQTAGQAQSPAKFVLEADKSKPGQKPAQPPGSGQSKGVGKPLTSTSQSAQPEATSTQDVPLAAAAQSCDLTLLLLRDDVRTAYVNVWNYPPNITAPVTLTQTTPGVVGYSATPAGPFTPTLNITVQTDGAGNGQSADFYIQGTQLGNTVTYGETPYGYTTSVGFTVLPQCNCPPIPVVQ